MNETLAVPAARVSYLAAALPELLFAGGAFAVTAALAAANGGYFPTSWGWSALALFFAAATALILRTSVRLGRLELVFLCLVAALVGWTWLSSVWSIDLSSSILEGQRALVLMGAVVATLALAPARPVRPLLGAVGLAATVVCAYALSTRLFPGRIGSYDTLAVYRLNTPVGYWNGLGVFAALGAVLALGFAARGSRRVTRGVAAASLLVLVPTLYFTFGRGAWLAGFAGLVVLFVLDSRRLQFAATALCVLPWPALGVALASQSDALTRQKSILPRAAHDGHRLALVLVLLAVFAAGAAIAAQQVEQGFFERLVAVGGAQREHVGGFVAEHCVHAVQKFVDREEFLRGARHYERERIVGGAGGEAAQDFVPALVGEQEFPADAVVAVQDSRRRRGDFQAVIVAANEGAAANVALD